MKQKKRNDGTRKRMYGIFIVFCMGLCALPLLGMLFGYTGKNLENRPLARIPPLWDEAGFNSLFPGKFDDYFDDHFGFREEMVTAFHTLTMETLGDTVNEKVDVGKAGMLFYADARNDYIKIDLLSGRDIGRAAVCLRLQQEYCETQGAAFAFAIAPNKSSVYPEYMPSYLTPAEGENNRERLLAALTAAGVNTIDFTAALTTAKAGGELLYHPEDTHWNALGALIGYRAIMEGVLPGVGNAYQDATFTQANDYGGDLHNFVLPAVAGANPRPVFQEELAYETEPQRPGRSVTTITNSTANEKMLYFFRDSFADALLPYLSANLGRVVYDAEFPYNYLNVPTEQPDAVVIELVERNIPNLLLKAPNVPAQETTPRGSVAGELTASAAAIKRNGNTMLIGAFEGAGYAPDTDRILVSITGHTGTTLCYEAFPILEEEAAQLIAGQADPCGLSLTLPTLHSGAYTARVMLETPRGLYEWGGQLEFGI